jgi:membrane protease YdiL (CAAX protease family)
MEFQFDLKQQSAFSQLLLLVLFSALLSLIGGLLIQMIAFIIPVISEFNTLFTYTLSFGSLYFLVKYLWNIDSIPTNWVSLSIFALVLPGILALSFISEGLVSLMPIPEFMEQIFASMVSLDIKGYLTIGIAAPLLEEFIFRGLILTGLLKKYNPQKAIIWSAVIFGFIHLNPWQFVPAFIIGIFIGWVFYHTKSVWPGVFIHFINNSFSFYIGLKYQDINTSFYHIAGSITNYLAMFGLAILICYGVYYLLKNQFIIQNKMRIE